MGEVEMTARHTVATLVESVSDDDLVAALGRLHYKDQDKQSEAYLGMRAKLREMKAEPTAMDCVLSRCWSMDDPPEPVVDVSGVRMGDPKSYAIAYEPWSQWLGMAVKAEPGLELSDSDMLANILYEMSWAGFDEEEIAERKTKILDAANEIDAES